MKRLSYYTFPFFILVNSCSNTTATDPANLEVLASTNLKELSGLEYVNGALWGIEDSGNEAKIYNINMVTGSHQGYDVGAKNNDWEDITSDPQGNLYIGDFGNNDNNRKNLKIIKVNPLDPATPLYTITFSYPEQDQFPPGKKNRNFDCEGFFEYNGYFYLFSKNRSTPDNDTVLVHKIQNTAGNTEAIPVGSFSTCNNFRKCAIAGADISPDGKTVALISGGKLWLITKFTGDDFANGTLKSYDLGEVTQKESICFTNSTTLLIADERDGNTGGKLYRIKLGEL